MQQSCIESGRAKHDAQMYACRKAAFAKTSKSESRIKEQRLPSNTLFSFEGAKPERSGDDSKEDPPVPMPNTEVKLLHVDDTWWETARESR